MKRTKQPPIETVQLPEDVWSVIVGFLLPRDETLPDLAAIINLIGTCKMLVRVLTKPILLLLNDYLLFSVNYDPKTTPVATLRESLFFYIKAVCEASNIPIDEYVSRPCTAENTEPHLSTCLSLFNLAYLEGHNLYQYNDTGTYTYVSLDVPTVFLLFSTVSEVIYFNNTTQQAECLSQYRDLLFVEDVTRSVHHRFSSATARLLESGKPLITRSVTPQDPLDRLVVKIDGQQHWFFSEAIAQIRSRCWLKHGLTLREATKLYLLDSFHVRNWKRVTTLTNQ